MLPPSPHKTDVPRTASVVVLLVLLAVLSAYLPVLDGPLIFDDLPNLLNNNFLLISGHQFDDWRIAASSGLGVWPNRPLSMLSFAANYVLAGGFSPSGLKTVNLMIHVLIGGLLYCLFILLLQSPAFEGRYSPRQTHWLALLGAAIWLLHPLHVSTVLYSVQRMAQLSTLFMVSGLLVFTRYRLAWSRRGCSMGEALAVLLWLSLLGVLGLLCKENAVLLPLLVVVVELCLFRGVIAGRYRAWLAGCAWMLLWLPVILVAAVWVWDESLLAAPYVSRDFTLEERVLTQLRVLWRYLGWLVIPNIFAMGFHHDYLVVSTGWLAPFTTLISLLAWVAAMLLAFVLRNRQPLLMFGLLFFLVGQSLESSIISLEMVYEHRNYLPSVGVCLALAALLLELTARTPRFKAEGACVLVIMILSVLLVIRSQAWSDELGLARHNVTIHPNSPRAHFVYGDALYHRATLPGKELSEEIRRDHIVAARQHFLSAHELDPSDLAAPVMLQQLDTTFFPGLPDAPDWLQVIEDKVGTRPLQSSDRTALRGLGRFSLTPGGTEARGRVIRLFDELTTRYPGDRELFAYRYRLRQESSEVDRETLLRELQLELERHPGRTELYAQLVQFHRLEDRGASYEAIRAWLAQDTRHRELGLITEIFRPDPRD